MTEGSIAFEALCKYTIIFMLSLSREQMIIRFFYVSYS